jgi:hypothetical protein
MFLCLIKDRVRHCLQMPRPVASPFRGPSLAGTFGAIFYCRGTTVAGDSDETLRADHSHWNRIFFCGTAAPGLWMVLWVGRQRDWTSLFLAFKKDKFKHFGFILLDFPILPTFPERRLRFC